MAENYPLAWPPGWPRTAVSARRAPHYKVTSVQALNELERSLGLLGADRRTIVVSSNLKNSFARSAVVDDPGVAVYWTTAKFGERVIACDKWNSVFGNLRALGIALEGFRAIERAGATQIMDRAFQAFGALPASTEAPARRPWWEVFGFSQEHVKILTLAMVEARYRELAKLAHPDAPFGGRPDEFKELTAARDEARSHYGG